MRSKDGAVEEEASEQAGTGAGCGGDGDGFERGFCSGLRQKRALCPEGEQRMQRAEEGCGTGRSRAAAPGDGWEVVASATAGSGRRGRGWGAASCLLSLLLGLLG